MNNDLLELLNRLSPSNHRLAREMIQRLAQLEQLAAAADHDARLHYHTYVTPWLQHLLAQGMSPSAIMHNQFPRRPPQPPCDLHARQVKHGP